jgi:hypothetical protein
MVPVYVIQLHGSFEYTAHSSTRLVRLHGLNALNATISHSQTLATVTLDRTSINSLLPDAKPYYLLTLLAALNCNA